MNILSERSADLYAFTVWWLISKKIIFILFNEFFVGLNFRKPRNFGLPHLHVSGGFEDRGITQ